MKRLKDNRKLHAIVVIDDFLSALNKYDGESLFLARYNETFFHYLKMVYFSLNNESLSRDEQTLLERKAKKDHPFIYALYRIFENKNMQKAHINELEALLKVHLAYPLHDFLLLFTKYKKGSDDFNKRLVRLLKQDDLLSKLWVIKNDIRATDKNTFPLLKELSNRGVTKASRYLLFESIKEEKSYINIVEQIELVINQNLYKDEKTHGDLYIKVASSSSSNNLKIAILQDALKLKYYDALIPLVKAYLNAKELGNKNLLEAYRYLVIAEFLNIDGYKELYIDYKTALKARKR